MYNIILTYFFFFVFLIVHVEIRLSSYFFEAGDLCWFFFCLPERDGESLNCKTRVRVTLFVGEAIF